MEEVGLEYIYKQFAVVLRAPPVSWALAGRRLGVVLIRRSDHSESNHMEVNYRTVMWSIFKA